MKKYFTLIELVIATTVIGIIVGTIVPKVFKTKNDAKVTAMEFDLNVVEIAVNEYMSVNRGSNYPFLDINNDGDLDNEDIYYKSKDFPQTLFYTLLKIDDDGSEIYKLDMDKLKPYIDKMKYPNIEYLYSKQKKIAIDPIGKNDSDDIMHHIIGVSGEKPLENSKPVAKITTNLNDINTNTIINWQYLFVDEDSHPTAMFISLDGIEYNSLNELPTQLEMGEYTIIFKAQDKEGLWGDEFIKSFTVETIIDVQRNDIALGDGFSLKIGTDGELYAWGYNGKGQLGIGNKTNQKTPKKVSIPNGEKAVAIAVGDNHSIAITNQGNLYTWGWNYYGQLGIGNTLDQNTPQKVTLPNGEKPVSISIGGSNSMTITDKGNIYSWGYNYGGQLGIGNTVNQTTPQKVILPNEEKAMAIFSGFFHSMCITNKGKVYSWGQNENGQLGLGNNINYSTPQHIKIPNNENPIFIDAKGLNSIMITSKKNLYIWGSGAFGILGTGSTFDQNSPQLITLPNGEKPISASVGYSHSAVITDNGKLYTWGKNLTGQLGIGSTSNKTTPQLVTLPNQEVPNKIILGYYHTLTITNNNNVYVWGKNNYGQLGIGSTTNQTKPVKVALP